jgi:thiamine-monophosphate kinase
MSGEFDFIRQHLAPIAGPGSRDLTDDAAHLHGLVLTKDVLVENVHFLTTDPLDLVARKALRVNASDLIAKGVTPRHYLLGLVLPDRLGEADRVLIARGLGEEQDHSGLALIGGDTTRGSSLVISVTMFGTSPSRGGVTRSGARAGDLVGVTGTIGDGLLGLEAARQGRADEAAPYWLPPVPYGFEATVSRYATASVDISDGLVADLGHLAVASGVAIGLDAARIPLSEGGRAAAAEGRLAELLTAGDDYQTAFTFAPMHRDILERRPDVSIIGEVQSADGHKHVTVIDPDGDRMSVGREGWDHFGDR